MIIYFWLFLVFVVGAVVGSFLNVAIARLPMEKSLLWPGSRCGSCLQPVRWYDNLPILSYLILRGRCRSCGQRFSPRYLVIEVITALGFVGLFYLEVVENIHGWPARPHEWLIARNIFPVSWWIGFLHHAILFALLLVASGCDLQGREIPLGLTLPGTLLGLVLAVCLPWPWPWSPVEAAPVLAPNLPPGVQWQIPAQQLAAMGGRGFKEGIYAWPVWGPLPAWLAPGGTWQTGLATGLAGALVGTFMLRVIRFLFSAGLGKEALGLGDADLMMMGGAFLGWQMVVVAFFVSVVPGLFFGVFQMIFRRDNSLPFGPSLASGLMIACLCWNWLGPYVQPLFFWGAMLGFLAIFAAVFMLAASFVLRLMRRGEAEEGSPC